MLLASFLFGAMGAAVKLASSHYSAFELVMYRGLIGTVMLLILVRVQNGTLRTAFMGAHLWRGFVGVVSLWLWFYAIGKCRCGCGSTRSASCRWRPPSR
jgi:drug/metabolite transporter (DMT)-like permease